MARRRRTKADERARRAVTRMFRRAGARVAILNGPDDILRLARITRTLPPGAAVVENGRGGEIVLADGRRASWACGRAHGDPVVFLTVTERRKRQKLWRIPPHTKKAIHAACALR